MKKKPTVSDMSVRPIARPKNDPSMDEQIALIAREKEGAGGSQKASSGDLNHRPERGRRPPSWELAQLTIRIPKEKRRGIHQLALSLDMTAQDVFMAALDEYLQSRGLRLLDDIPQASTPA